MTELTTTEKRWAKWDDLRTRQELATTDEERETLRIEEEQLRDEGIRELLAEDIMIKPRWMWLSFADETGFLGAAIVQAGGLLEATIIARAKGCNPGGEVLGEPLTSLPPAEYRERLLSSEEIDEMRDQEGLWQPIESAE